MLTKFSQIYDFGAVQRNANLVDLKNPEKMRLLSLSEVSIQPRTSPLKFDQLAAESEKDPVTYLSTKVLRHR